MKKAARISKTILPLIIAVLLTTQTGLALFSSGMEPRITDFSVNGKPGLPVFITERTLKENSEGKFTLAGIMITSLPESEAGCLEYAGQALAAGSVIMPQQMELLSFTPAGKNETRTKFTFIPVSTGDKRLPAVTVFLNLMERDNTAPEATAVKLDTAKNIAAEGRFEASDPDGDKLTYEIMRVPKHGSVSISANDPQVYVYTPDQNKSGKDSFTYRAVDEYGGVSIEAKVTVNIAKKTAVTYTDMSDSLAHYPAVFLAEKNVYQGRSLGGQAFFYPEETVTRAEFLAMSLALAGYEEKSPTNAATGFTDDDAIPTWARGMALYAEENGLIRGRPDGEGCCFAGEEPVGALEAAVIVYSALELGEEDAVAVSTDPSVPVWAHAAVAALAPAGMLPEMESPEDTLTREEAAKILYNAYNKTQAEEKTGLFSWAGVK